jgi:predicted flavoprotein YhiN
MGSFKHGNLHPERAAMFDTYMAELTRRWVGAILASHDFSPACRIVDIGGGNGVLMSAILVAYPQAEGIIFDTAAGIAGAARRLEKAGVLERCRIVAGDFFDEVPQDTDTYILKSVLHDWSDDDSIAILKNCCRAMGLDSTLIVIERPLPERILADDAHREIVMMDIHMLVATGGRERTVSRYNELLAAAGLTVISARPTSSPFTILTAARMNAAPVSGGKP